MTGLPDLTDQWDPFVLFLFFTFCIICVFPFSDDRLTHLEGERHSVLGPGQVPFGVHCDRQQFTASPF